MSDSGYVDLVRELDERVAKITGRGFGVTPYRRASELGVWVKDETGNVADSHKARHLFGVEIYLRVARRTDWLGEDFDRRPLAIASCGNAALAAAVIARAADRSLRVFLPTRAEAGVVKRLQALGAELVVCERGEDDPPGDPGYLRFISAVHDGAVPFTCQGPQNGLTIDGGMTLGWELVAQHTRGEGPPLDHLFLQVGASAFASVVMQSLRWAHQLGALSHLPAIHAVQTVSAHPLHRAWRRVAREIAERLFPGAPFDDESDAQLAARIDQHRYSPVIESVLRQAARHRSRYMKPVEEVPRSIATGILDAETYDWLEIVRGMLQTGGWPVLVPEEELAEARDRGREATGIEVSATGAAGLAGVFVARKRGEVFSDDEVGVVFTG